MFSSVHSDKNIQKSKLKEQSNAFFAKNKEILNSSFNDFSGV